MSRLFQEFYENILAKEHAQINLIQIFNSKHVLDKLELDSPVKKKMLFIEYNKWSIHMNWH